MAPFSRVNHDLASLLHRWILALTRRQIPARNG
jgi:hypothetical protein